VIRRRPKEKALDYIRNCRVKISGNGFSIPTLIPNLDLAVFQPDLKTGDIFISGRSFDRAGTDAKARAVARADDFIAGQFAAGDFGAVMAANVFYRIKLAGKIKYSDIDAIDIYYQVFFIRQGLGGTYGYPIGHDLTSVKTSFRTL
jgi:hypothetical protein